MLAGVCVCVLRMGDCVVIPVQSLPGCEVLLNERSCWQSLAPGDKLGSYRSGNATLSGGVARDSAND